MHVARPSILHILRSCMGIGKCINNPYSPRFLSVFKEAKLLVNAAE